MSTELRATCRAVGQVALLASAASTLYSVITMVTWCVGSSEICAALWEGSSAVTMTGLHVVTALALLAWWATCRHHGRVLAQASVCLVIAYLLGWHVYGLVTDETPEAALTVGTKSVTYMLIAVAPMVLLLLSYRGRDHVELDEPSQLRWIWLLLPLVALRAGYFYLPISVSTPAVLWLAVAGGLYGVLRRSRPVPGAASWLLVSLVLTGLALPAATAERWITPASFFGDSAWLATSLWLVAVAVVGAFAAAHWARARRGRAGLPAGWTSPADAT